MHKAQKKMLPPNVQAVIFWPMWCQSFSLPYRYGIHLSFLFTDHAYLIENIAVLQQKPFPDKDTCLHE